MIEYYLVALAVLFFLDAWITTKIIAAGGAEGNPIVAKLIGWLGARPALYGSKLVAFGIVWQIKNLVPVLALQILVAFYIVIFSWNVEVLRKQKNGS